MHPISTPQQLSMITRHAVAIATSALAILAAGYLASRAFGTTTIVVVEREHACPAPAAPAPPPAAPAAPVEFHCDLPAAAAVAPPAATPVAPPPVAGIERLDATHYTIDQRLIDLLTANPVLLARSARIVPTISDGHPIGIKIYAIRPGSPIAALGLRNGDTLIAVNGISLASVDHGLEAYDRARTARTLELQLRRRGQALTLHYAIIDR